MILSLIWLNTGFNQTMLMTIGDLTPTGYSFQYKLRLTRGGGVSVSFENGFDISKSTISSHQFQTFEFMVCKLGLKGTLVALLFVAFLPHQIVITSPTFFWLNLQVLLEQYIAGSARLLIAGDFNSHVDDYVDKTSQNFLVLYMDSFNLEQHVCSPTDSAGHTLNPRVN